MARTDADGDANDRTVVERRDPLVGTVLDRRFRIDFRLAAGGFGAIYRATDLRADVEVALKVLHPQLTHNPSVVARFRREGKTLANLRDPHTISAYELGEAEDGTLYIVMELLHGESLYQRFRSQGRMPWRRVLHIARGVCSSLAEAHALGIVHRDLKPANIHLETAFGDPDFVKVLDFGIAKIVQGSEADRNDLTQVGQMVGTVEYMSPEQMAGGAMTGSSDIYTLGVVMYEMISGRTPFAGAQTATAVLTAVLTQTPDPLSRHADVPPRLDDIIARCLEREPRDRFADIGELIAAFDAISSPEAERLAVNHDATLIDFRLAAPASDTGTTGKTAPVDRPTDPAISATTLIPAPRLAVEPATRPVGPPRVLEPLRPPVVATPPPVGAASAPVADLPTRRGGWQATQLAPPFGQPAARRTSLPPSYDMTAAASRDAMVRRIIWGVVLALAVTAIGVATC